MTTSKQVPNRLINEKSPYLLQHAYNPVNWYTWGEEAFAKAKAEDKPVFLSIGYSTCHWCHVMAHESFEDAGVAAILNEGFISIKVDREERPDVDHVYMSACTALTGSGGWPLSAFLTPDREAFYAGTYFPKTDRYGHIGFISLLGHISDAWLHNRAELEESAANITAHIREDAFCAEVSSDITRLALKSLMSIYDGKWGGFGRAPKFPSPHNLMFLMRAGYGESADGPIWKAVRHTLKAMADGGLRDHVGGGFCRYSTDERWLVPHFEKMLYDNALLCMAYSECYEKTGEFANIVREIITYAEREMLAPEGCFYTAQDADSEGVEGKFYCWTPAEVKSVLGAVKSERFCSLYDITQRGNFEAGSIPNLIGKNPSDDDLVFASDAVRRLYETREKRVHPLRDEKALLTSNALFCAALAKAGRTLAEQAYVDMAARCAEFMLANFSKNDRLYAVWHAGAGTAQPATLDGYAYLVWALIELYESTMDARYISKAVRTHELMEDLFAGENGELYYSRSDVEDLPMRGINAHDGAVPSGQSVAAHNMLRLSRITGKLELEERCGALIRSLSGTLEDYPTGHTWLLAAMIRMENGGTDVVLVKGDGMDELLAELKGFFPFISARICGDGDEGLSTIEGKAAAYVCRGATCLPPVSSAKELRAILSA